MNHIQVTIIISSVQGDYWASSVKILVFPSPLVTYCDFNCLRCRDFEAWIWKEIIYEAWQICGIRVVYEVATSNETLEK